MRKKEWSVSHTQEEVNLILTGLPSVDLWSHSLWSVHSIASPSELYPVEHGDSYKLLKSWDLKFTSGHMERKKKNISSWIIGKVAGNLGMFIFKEADHTVLIFIATSAVSSYQIISQDFKWYCTVVKRSNQTYGFCQQWNKLWQRTGLQDMLKARGLHHTRVLC